jgi:hypothetical protein
MNLITVKLRFVGLYFNAPVEIDLDAFSGAVTVKNVMDTYIASHPITLEGGLAYSASIDTGNGQAITSLTSVTHNYGGKFDFDANGNPASQDGKTLLNELRPAGLYQLTEFVIPATPNSIVTWQYYVQDSSGNLKSKTPKGPNKITPFDKLTAIDGSTTYTIANGDTIVWRMIAILLGPSVTGKQKRKLELLS